MTDVYRTSGGSGERLRLTSPSSPEIYRTYGGPSGVTRPVRPERFYRVFSGQVDTLLDGRIAQPYRVTSGVPGRDGSTGPQGPIGTDLHYTHTQSIASSMWTIVHNLGKYPSVSIVDSAGTLWISDVRYIDPNSLVVTFGAAFGGSAYLN